MYQHSNNRKTTFLTGYLSRFQRYSIARDVHFKLARAKILQNIWLTQVFGIGR